MVNHEYSSMKTENRELIMSETKNLAYLLVWIFCLIKNCNPRPLSGRLDNNQGQFTTSDCLVESGKMKEEMACADHAESNHECYFEVQLV